MQKSFLKCLLAAGVAVLALALGTSAFAQGVTTSTLSGFVTDKSGKSVASATVTVLHEPSGTTVVGTTRANGQYNFAGLRIGGPYTVTVTTREFAPQSQKEIYLNLNQDQVVSFVLSSDVVAMEAFRVEGTRDTTFDSGKMGAVTTFSSEEIGNIPTIRRDVQDIANMDTRVGLTLNTSYGEFAVSVQGQNSRYNSFLIDGMQSNDPFGLNANGFSSLRSPIPLDAIAGLSIDLSPYDVTRTGFTGALISAVTKSGTNEYHGSAYSFYTGKTLRADNPVTKQQDQLQERYMGFTFGGPLIRNKLFFFGAYDDYRKVTAVTQNFVPDATTAAAIKSAAAAWGYDVGSLTINQAESTQKTYLVKLDWNINANHRASATYRRTEGKSPYTSGYTGSTYTCFSNYLYTAQRLTDNYSAQINSTWTPDFRTDAGAAYIKYNGTAKNNGTPFPEIYINSVSGTRLDTGATVTNGAMDIGTNYSYQYNNLYTKNYNGHLYGEYSLGDHTLKFGADSDKNQYDDKFVQYYYGRYAFANVSDFAAGKANHLRYQQASPGYTIPQSFAYYSRTDYGALIQDTWKPNSDLTITAGLRYDYPFIPNKPPVCLAFSNAFGRTNTYTASGNQVFAPRFGFNYNLPKSFLPTVLGGRKTQVRGGFGLFQGTNPAVWVANVFQTAGVLNSVTLGTSSTSSTVSGTIAFNPSATYVQTLAAPSTPTPVVNTLDPNFRTPTSWKGNIAIDHTLPWWDLVATLEANYLMVERGVYYQSLNIKPTGVTAFDGRVMYSGNYYSTLSTVLNLANTSQGGSQTYTIGVKRPMKNHWSFSLGYSHTHATEVQPLTSSVAYSSYSYRASLNPNDGSARNSAYSVPNKFVLTVAREFNFFKRPNTRTLISADFKVQTGHAYSWVFYGDVNGDGIYGNDSFYVPNGPNDPMVTWSTTAQCDAFFKFVNGTDLKKYLGQVCPPNSSYNPQTKTVNLHIEQEIPVYKRAKLSVFFDCINFANLFNKSWGEVTGLDFSTSYSGYNRSVCSASYSSSTGKYTYAFTSSTLGGTTNFTDLSRWQLQIGAKLQF